MGRDAGGAKKYIVRLSNDERTYLEKIIGTGRDAAGRLLKARILLKADIGAGGEVKAWQAHRNKHNAKADWHFSNQTARVKLKHLYPAI